MRTKSKMQLQLNTAASPRVSNSLLANSYCVVFVMALSFTKEEAALILPILQRRLASNDSESAGAGDVEMGPEAAATGDTGPGTSVDVPSPETAEGDAVERYSATDMFKKKKKNSAATPAQNYLLVSY